MNHPKREDWVRYFYHELEPQLQSQMRNHLAECPDCRTQINEWKHTRQLLDGWKLPSASARTVTCQPLLRWALAFSCVALLACGFLAGRLTLSVSAARQLDVRLLEKAKQDLRAEFAQALQDELSKAATATLAASAEQTQSLLTEYNQTVESRLHHEKEQRLAAFLALKRDVDTLAINADAGLQTAEQRLAQLAGMRLAQHTPSQSR